VRNFFSISSKGEDEKDYDLQDTSSDIERDVDGILKNEMILKEINALPFHFKEAVLCGTSKISRTRRSVRSLMCRWAQSIAG